jgi:archaellum biogenesis ATPase FlaH
MYQNEDPFQFLQSQGSKYRQHGDELITTCLLCGKEDHLYIHASKGVWKCHHCSESGNLYQLRKRLGLPHHGNDDGLRGIQSLGQAIGGSSKKTIPPKQVEAMHAALLADKEALAYCINGRRWTLEVIKTMKIGLRIDTRGKWLAYPYWQKGKCIALKYRILPAYLEKYPKRFEREPGCESILYNEDSLEGQEEAILASGESDLISLLILGFKNAVATSTGESGLPPAAVDALIKMKKVFLPYDNDAAGQKGAREAAKRIGFDRSFLMRLPEGIKDVNEFLVKGRDREAFEQLLSQAKRFDIPTIYSLDQALDKLVEQKTLNTQDQDQDTTPWPSVNRIIGPWEGGNLIIVSGPQGTGKTTFCSNINQHFASRGLPGLLYCLEMNLHELAQHILCAHYEMTEEEITIGVIDQARIDLADWPLFIGANPQITDIKDVANLLRQAARRYGLRLIVFDNLHMLSRSLDHHTQEIGIITKTFKSLAMELEIPIVLIAQPRKLKPGRIMTPWDLKDSVDIFSDADQIILLHREHIGPETDEDAVAEAENGSTQNQDPKTLIRLAKARHRPSDDTVLYLEGSQHRFHEIEIME